MTQTLSRILYVEDEEAMRTIAQLALETVGGFTRQVCSGGEQADIFSPNKKLAQ